MKTLLRSAQFLALLVLLLPAEGFSQENKERDYEIALTKGQYEIELGYFAAAIGHLQRAAGAGAIFNRYRFGCDESDDIGFLIEAGMEGRGRVRLHICCGSSFRGCRFALSPSEKRDDH